MRSVEISTIVVVGILGWVGVCVIAVGFVVSGWVTGSLIDEVDVGSVLEEIVVEDWVDSPLNVGLTLSAAVRPCADVVASVVLA